MIFRHGLSAVALVCALTAPPAQASPNHGAYLAGQAAAAVHDFDEAAYWFGVALEADPSNPAIIENTLASMVGAGDLLGAAGVAGAALDQSFDSQIVNLVLDADAARRGDWQSIFAAKEAGREVSPLVDGLIQAWAHVGEGNMSAAIAGFDAVIAAPGLQNIGTYHKALAFAAVGDFESTAQILTLPPAQGMAPTRRSIIALAMAQSQLGQNDVAVEMLTQIFGPDPDLRLTSLRDRLAAGEQVPFDLVASPREGVGEIFLSVANILGDEAPVTVNLLYLRIAQTLHPRDAEISVLAAERLEDLENFELASAAYELVLPDDPSFYSAEIGRAAVLRKAGKPEEGIEALQTLVAAYPDRPVGHIALGDALRRQAIFEASNASYTNALDRLAPDDPRLWFAHYMRAITFHQLDQWPAAESDFRQALSYQPDHPQVLNYLGYSLIERREKLDEALAMIERAVEAQPDNGAIVDSLGWGLFVLGRVEEAVAPMERAAALEPVDPVINDHLGDVYWSVGRYREAIFQWNRALSFDPEPELATQIRDKIEFGLPPTQDG